MGTELTNTPLNIEIHPFIDTNECSEIILINGDIIEAVDIEIGKAEIKYKKCSKKEGSTWSILKSDVFMIKHENGETIVFEEEKKRKLDGGIRPGIILISIALALFLLGLLLVSIEVYYVGVILVLVAIIVALFGVINLLIGLIA